jgi:hypothetical protein
MDDGGAARHDTVLKKPHYVSYIFAEPDSISLTSTRVMLCLTAMSLNAILDGTNLQDIAVSETLARNANRQVSLSGFRVVRADEIAILKILRYKVVARFTTTSVENYLFVKSRLPYPILTCAINNPLNI